MKNYLTLIACTWFWLLYGTTYGQQIKNRVVIDEQQDRLVIKVASHPLATYVFADPDIPRPYFAHLKTLNGKQVSRNHPPIGATTVARLMVTR